MNSQEMNFTGFENQFSEPPIEYLVLNVTRNLPVDYLVVLFGYITPVFFLITVVANIMIVLVLSRPTMLTPTNLVLLAMAVADLLTLVFPVPWYFYIYTLNNYKTFLGPATICNLYHYNTEILPAFFHTASIWLTLLLAAQRYVYICHPSLAKIWCTNGRVAKVIAGTFVGALLHQFPRFFERHYENLVIETGVMGVAHETVACRLVMSSWVSSIEDVYFSSYFIFRIIFVHIGPCLILVILNLLLYSALKRAERTRARLFLKSGFNSQSVMTDSPSELTWKRKQSLCPPLYDAETSTSGADPHGRRYSCKPLGSRVGGTGSGRDANSTTFMLIVVVTVFLIVEIPLAATTAVHIIENLLEIELVSDQALNMTIIISNFFIIITYPLNFAIYCGMSRAFRLTFQQLFVRRWNANTLQRQRLSQKNRHGNDSVININSSNSANNSTVLAIRQRSDSVQTSTVTPVHSQPDCNNGVKGQQTFQQQPSATANGNNNANCNSNNSNSRNNHHSPVVGQDSEMTFAQTIVSEVIAQKTPTVEIVQQCHLESMV